MLLLLTLHPLGDFLHLAHELGELIAWPVLELIARIAPWIEIIGDRSEQRTLHQHHF
jgi:hypothetical protein